MPVLSRVFGLPAALRRPFEWAAAIGLRRLQLKFEASHGSGKSSAGRFLNFSFNLPVGPIGAGHEGVSAHALPSPSLDYSLGRDGQRN